ncbi:MAG: hypothetical protein WEA11_04155 [Acidimicrobiales bacterium]
MNAALENWFWREGTVVTGTAVVFDMDGVLSNASDRQHHLVNHDWDGFFEACGDDEVIHELARLLSLLASDLRVILLTARPLRVQPQTLAWLARHDLRWDLLCMREDGSGQEAWQFKQRTVTDLRAHGFDLQLAFEDDRRNADMFHAQGIPCVYIHSGYYE